MKAYEGCHEPFLRYCSALAYSQMDAEDLVQDVLLSAYQNYEKIEKKSELLHYLIRTTRNRSVSIWTKRRKEVDLMHRFEDRMYAKGVSADQLIDIKIMYSALKELPPSQQDAVVLFEISGFSMKEIAEIQGSTEGAVKTLVSRGRSKLRLLLSEESTDRSTSHVLNALRTITL